MILTRGNRYGDIIVRPLPENPGLHTAAKSQPGGWVYDLDYAYPDDQRVPPEAIRGAWESSADGRLTGHYAANQRYRAIRKQEPDLKPYMHAGARTNRNQWIVDIDRRGESFFPDIPDFFIRGWWYVDKSGVISNLFRPNALWVEDEAQQLTMKSETVQPSAVRLAEALAALMFATRSALQASKSSQAKELMSVTHKWENEALPRLASDLQAIQPLLSNPLQPENAKGLLHIAMQNLVLVNDLDALSFDFADPGHKRDILASAQQTVLAAGKLIQALRA